MAYGNIYSQAEVRATKHCCRDFHEGANTRDQVSLALYGRVARELVKRK